jgi:hypothetical protein
MVIDWTGPPEGNGDLLYATFGSTSSGRFGVSYTYADYRSIIPQYTKRALTFDSDILRAFAGVSYLFGRAMKTEMHYGIPMCYIDSLLLWRPEKALKRRKGFPSWSWCGWIGTTGYWPDSHYYSSTEAWQHEATYISYFPPTDQHLALTPGSIVELHNLLSGHVRDPEILSNISSSPAQGVWAVCDYALDFWAYVVPLKLGPDSLFWRREKNNWSSLPYKKQAFPRLSRDLPQFDALDGSGEFCGTILLHAEMDGALGKVLDFVVLSESDHRDYKTETFPYLNIMVVTWENGLAERVGMGLLRKTALDNPVGEDMGWKRLNLG